MRLGRLLIIVAILVILGLVAIYALLNLGTTPPAGGEGTGSGGTAEIVIVMQPIPRGGVVTAESLGTIPYPVDQINEGMFTSIGDALGLRARYDLDQNVPLTRSMVVETPDQVAETGSENALLIPSGMVAFPIPIDRFSSLAYGLRAGDHVNVISTMLMVDMDGNFQSILPNNSAAVLGPGAAVISNIQSSDSNTPTLTMDPLINALTAQIVSGGPASPQGSAIVDPVLNQPFYVVPSEVQRPRLVSQTLLQDIVILHVGNFLYTDTEGNEVAPPSTEIDAAGNAIASTTNPPDLITLIVSPQDAVTLNWLIYAGSQLTLALRSAGDDSIIATQAVTLEYLLTTYDIPVPTKLPYGLNPRIDSLESPTIQDALPLPPAP
jgi:Flp pilus assembly protein CpaB